MKIIIKILQLYMQCEAVQCNSDGFVFLVTLPLVHTSYTLAHAYSHCRAHTECNRRTITLCHVCCCRECFFCILYTISILSNAVLAVSLCLLQRGARASYTHRELSPAGLDAILLYKHAFWMAHWQWRLEYYGFPKKNSRRPPTHTE